MQFLIDCERLVDIETCVPTWLLDLHSPYGIELWERSSDDVAIEDTWTTVKNARLVTHNGNAAAAIREAKRRGWSPQMVSIKF